MKHDMAIILAFFLAFNLANSAEAKLLDLDASNINGSVIVQDGKTYEILSDEKFSVIYLENGMSEFRRIIVQDVTIMDKLKARIEELEEKINQTEERIDYLKARVNVLVFRNETENNVLEALEKQRNLYKAELQKLEEVKSELENMITSNIILSPMSYRIGIVVLIGMLVLVLIGKGASLFGGKKKNNKKGEVGIE